MQAHFYVPPRKRRRTRALAQPVLLGPDDGGTSARIWFAPAGPLVPAAPGWSVTSGCSSPRATPARPGLLSGADPSGDGSMVKDLV